MSRINAALLSLLVALPLAASALERSALLPPEASAHVRLSDSTGFLEKLEKSSFGKLWADRQFQDFVGNPDEDIWKEFFFDGEMDAEDKIMLEQLKMLKGETILAFEPDNSAPFIIAAISEEDFLRSLDMDEKLADSADEPFEIIKDSFQDILIVQHIENAGSPEESRSWQAHLDNTLLLGHSREWVEQSIVRLKKESIKEPEGNPVLEISLPCAKLIRNALEKDTSPQEIDGKALMEALGLLGVESFFVRIELKDTEMVVDNTLRATSLGKGLFTILDTEPSEMPADGFIPETLASLEIGRFDLFRFWKEIPAVLSAAMPSIKPQYDMAIAILRQQTGIDLEQDLLANLGTRYISFAVTENEGLVSVMAIDLKDSQAFRRGFETLMASPVLQPQITAMLDISDFLGHTLYVSKSADTDESIAFAVVGNYLLYGQPAGLRQVIRSESSDTPSNTKFQQTELVQGLRRHVPPSAFGYSAIDWKKNMDYILRQLAKPEIIEPFRRKWATSGSPLPPPDFGKLPPASHIATFFNIGYQYIEKTSDGLHQRIIFTY